MVPLRTRIRQLAEQTKVPQTVVEKDDALSYVLAGIAAQPELASTLVFKGGTALKKLVFGDDRFSEDLDCSTLDAPRPERLEEVFRHAMVATERLLRAQGPFTLVVARYEERDPHPGGQQAFAVRVQFPWQPRPLCRIMVEITHDEPVLLAPEPRALIHGYGEDLSAQVRCYRLEEMVAEKMRTLLQTHRQLVARGWSRPRARDYYDLWRVLGVFGDTLEREGLTDLLHQKSVHRGVQYRSLDDFFPEALVAEVRTHWNRSLGPFVFPLPACEEVLVGLKSLLVGFFPALKPAAWP